MALSSSLAAVAQQCADPPEFGVQGELCSTDRQDKPCGCSETLTWDAVASADWYEIHRCDVVTGDCLTVGDTRWRNREVTLGPGGSYHAGVRPAIWIPAWDQPFPEPLRVYEYAVTACDVRGDPDTPVCSDEPSNWVRYGTAPYMCIENGVEVACAFASVPPADRAGDFDRDGVSDSDDADDDNDGAPDAADNCQDTPNPGQRDQDGDGTGDACDPCPRRFSVEHDDTDGDGVADECDTCTWVFDPGQEDIDRDGVGDACDNCALSPNPEQKDHDDDGIGSVCDNCVDRSNFAQKDTDRDGIGNACDVCRSVYDPAQADRDGDGAGDACDVCEFTRDRDQSDRDADGVGDACDVCADDPDPLQQDMDRDGIGDSCDICPAAFDPDQADVDFDGLGDGCDNCALRSNSAQRDDDEDGAGNPCDVCPDDPNPSQSDLDADGVGDHCDLDDNMIYLRFDDPETLQWQAEAGHDTWNVYAGDIEVLREQGAYTQRAIDSSLAWRDCRVRREDSYTGAPPLPGDVQFFLVTARGTPSNNELGNDSTGSERPNTRKCN